MVIREYDVEAPTREEATKLVQSGELTAAREREDDDEEVIVVEEQNTNS